MQIIMNRIKNYWLLATLGWLFAIVPLEAQIDKYIDKVELTNGSIIWGLSEIDSDLVKIYLTNGDSIAVPVEHIKSLKTGKINPEWYSSRIFGVYYQISAGVLIGKSSQYSVNTASFSTSFVSGYKFNQWWGIGLGMGLDYYPDQRHIPLFLEVQGNLLEGRITPFYGLNAGWSWAEDRNSTAQLDRIEGGFYLKPSLGIRWHSARYSWHLQVSYVRQQSTAYYEPVDFGNGNVVTNVEDRVLQRIGISTGVTF